MPSRIVRCRIPCELNQQGRTERGIAINVSEQGLFVQTRATFPVDANLELRILATPGQPEFRVPARVARSRKVHPSAQVVVARGMGLEVLEEVPEWLDLTTRLGCRTAEHAESAPASDPTFGLPSFRVVLRRKDGIRIRTRVVQVACLDAQEARFGVEADVEEGWEIVRIERQSLRGEAPAQPHRFRVVAVHEGSARRWETTFESASAEEARQAARADLGSKWRVETVEPLGEKPVTPEAAPGAGAEQNTRRYQVKARHEEGERVRTRIAKVNAASPEDAAARVVAHLGEGWQAVKVTPL